MNPSFYFIDLEKVKDGRPAQQYTEADMVETPEEIFQKGEFTLKATGETFSLYGPESFGEDWRPESDPLSILFEWVNNEEKEN